RNSRRVQLRPPDAALPALLLLDRELADLFERDELAGLELQHAGRDVDAQLALRVTAANAAHDDPHDDVVREQHPEPRHEVARRKRVVALDEPADRPDRDEEPEPDDRPRPMPREPPVRHAYGPIIARTPGGGLYE